MNKIVCMMMVVGVTSLVAGCMAEVDEGEEVSIEEVEAEVQSGTWCGVTEADCDQSFDVCLATGDGQTHDKECLRSYRMCLVWHGTCAGAGVY